MTPAEAAKVVATLAALFPTFPISPATSAGYERMLADLEFKAASEAVTRLVRTSRFFPTVAEIRAMAVDIHLGPKRLGAEAWGDVGEAIRRVGSYRPAPKFADPDVGRCVEAMGWLSLCRSTNETADRARFIELYDGLQERARADLVAGHALPSPRPAQRLSPPGRPEVAPRLENAPAGNVAQLVAGVGRAMP